MMEVGVNSARRRQRSVAIVAGQGDLRQPIGDGDADLGAGLRAAAPRRRGCRDRCSTSREGRLTGRLVGSRSMVGPKAALSWLGNRPVKACRRSRCWSSCFCSTGKVACSSVQDRLAYAGESFKERYGVEAASHAPPIRQMLDAGLIVGGRAPMRPAVASYNLNPGSRSTGWCRARPWVIAPSSLHRKNRLSRQESTAAIYRRQRVVQRRREDERHDRAGSVCRFRGPLGRLSHCARGANIQDPGRRF